MLTLAQCLFHSSVTTVAHERPQSPAKSAGGRLHLNTHTPLTLRSRSGLILPLSRYSVGSYQEMSSRNLSGNIWLQSSQPAEPLWTNPGIKSVISVCELISNSKQQQQKQQNCRQGMNGRTVSQTPRKRGQIHNTNISRSPFPSGLCISLQ